MRAEIEHSLYDGMKHEQSREAPPAGFPELPLIPGGRYTDPAFLELEQRYLWKRSWLYALHVDELPRPGSYRLWRKTGAPIIIVRDKESRIRAAVSEFVERHPDVRYFHSYEMVMTAERQSDYFREDGRHVHRHAVKYIVSQFLRLFGDPSLQMTDVDSSWLTPIE